MGFTREYLDLCHRWRDMFNNKEPKYGDWYGNLSAEQMRIFTGTSELKYGSSDCFYIPDLDDLFELLHCQVGAIQQLSEPQMQINVSFDNVRLWEANIEVDGRITYVFKSESLHEALLKALAQMTILEKR
jgi:hypothetical protein